MQKIRKLLVGLKPTTSWVVDHYTIEIHHETMVMVEFLNYIIIHAYQTSHLLINQCGLKHQKAMVIFLRSIMECLLFYITNHLIKVMS